MAQNSWPFENVDTTEDQYSLLFGRYGKPGSLFMGVASQPNQTGAGSLTVYGDSSGMQVKVRSGFAVVRGFAYQNTTNGQTVAIDTGSASPRIDLIVLTLDPSANTIVLAVVKGTPAASPTAPSLTQNDTTGIYQMEIGRVLVPALATSVAAGDVTDTRPCLPVGAGVWTTTQRPAGVQGQMGWNVTNNQLEVYTGSAWQEVKPSSIDASIITTGTISNSRISALPLANVSSLPYIAGTFLAPNGSGGWDSGRVPEPLYSGKVNNPTVGTSYTTTGPSVSTSNNSAYHLVSGSCVIGAAAADRTITMKMQVGSSTWEEFDLYIPSGKTGHISATMMYPSSGTNQTFKLNFKSSSSTTTSIDSYLTVLGIN